MSNLVKSRWWSLPLLVLSLQYGLAQAPSGPVNFAFNSASTAVYDVSGTYTFTQDIIGTGGTLVPLTISELPLTQDRSGRLQGGGRNAFVIVTLGDSAVAANYTATGRVSGGGNRPTRVLLNVRLSGNDVVAGVHTPFSISVRYDFTVDPASSSLVGSARGHASFGGLSGGSIKSDDLVVPLPPGMDGTWSVQMDVSSLARLGGSGNIVLSNGRILPVRLTGSYSANTLLSRVRLSGILNGENDGRGNALSLYFFTGATQPEFATGTILGQKVLQ